jgi:hypothetical protein
VSARAPNTPGIFGYAAGVAVSCVVFGLLFMLPSLQFYDVGDSVSVLMLYVPICSVTAAALGVPVWLPGVLLVHVTCTRVVHQVAHVAVAGLAGLALGLAASPVLTLGLGYGGHVYVAVAVGVAAAAGRAAVVPLVHSRQRLAAAGRLTGTARW